RDGNSISSSVMGNFSGKYTHELLYTGNYMTIEFTSNREINQKVFSIQWKEKECYQELPGTSGTITFPRHSEIYNNNVHCEWKINTTTGTRIEVTFNSFDIHLGDQLYFRDGNNGEDIIIPRNLENNIERSFISNTNILNIFFTSDDDSSDSVFIINWKEIDGTECKKYINGDYGIFDYSNNEILTSKDRGCKLVIVAEE
ncbi:unnamed protein product, partial [Meganyctiphanes norvegica]